MTEYHGPGPYIFNYAIGYVFSKREYDYLLQLSDLKGKLKKLEDILTKKDKSIDEK
jgi:hypothetical protein